MSTRTALGARTLDRKYYTSAGVYDQETDRIFLKRWLYAGRLSRLSAAGSYFVFEIDGESVIILLDGAEVRAFHNTCRHRGTQLCSVAEGRLSKSIQCCYHAWTYALDGSLIGAPNMDEVEGFDKADYPLLAVAVAVWEGGIFVNLDPDAEPFAEAYAPLIGKFQQWRLAELQVAHEIVYDVAANWKLVVQNYSECYHCPSLHPALNRLSPYRNSANDLEEGPFLGGPMRLAQDGGSMTMSGRTCAPTLGDVNGEDLNLIYYYTIFPNLLLSLHPDYVLVHQILRLAPDKTRIVCQWLFHPDAIAQADFDPSDAVEFWNMTNKQDWEVSEMSQRGISSRAYRPGPYAELESMLATWDRQYLETIGEGSGGG
jgi:Rieske 2Fe-2S family protein